MPLSKTFSSSRLRAVTLLLLLVVGLVHITPSYAFIRASGTHFVDEKCNDFAFVGANAWRVLEGEALAGTPGYPNIDGLSPTEWMFKTAADNNLTVIRMFATGVEDYLPIQTKPGEYNEKALRALDESLDLASKYGVMVTLILARMWQGPDALANYASWTGTPINNFFSDPDALKAFLDHITFMVNRKNTVNGKLYKDDATIFSWNLMNEPRFFGNDTQCNNDPKSCADTMNTWIKTTSDHLKQQDPNHMIAIGSEGFFGSGSKYESANPAGDWAVKTGQDFERNSQNPSIDYAEAHLWLDNWSVGGDSNKFISDWIAAHEKAATDMNKPFHLEEFGKNTTNPFDPNSDGQEAKRRETFKTAFDELTKSLQSGNSMRAASYWMFDPNLQSPQSNGYADYGQDQVPVDSFSFKEIIVPAAKAATQVHGVVNGCEPGLVGALSAASGLAGAPAGEFAPVSELGLVGAVSAALGGGGAPAGEAAPASEQIASAGRKLKMLLWV